MKCKLSDFICFKNGKKRPIEEGTVPVYGGNGVLGYTNLFNNQNCVIIGRVGAYCGAVYYEANKCWVSDNAIVGNEKENVDIKFIYYSLKTLSLNQRHIGTSQPLLTQEILNKIEVDLPDLGTQKKIAKILSALDDKIECNNQINKNLEDQVSAIYSSWFENFDLYNGECPENWFLGKLSDIAEISSGKRPLIKTNICDSEFCIPIVGAASVMGFTNKANYSERILVTGRVGTHGVIQRFNSQCWASDNTLVIKSRYYEFTNQILKRIDYTSMNRGSTQPLITQGDLNKVKILLPDKDMLDKFEYVAGGLMNQYERNVNENIKLSELRDTLLPKLMSGELDVSDIDI